jgi:alpha-tubulin suppressor-like RCC1 family protein
MHSTAFRFRPLAIASLAVGLLALPMSDGATAATATPTVTAIAAGNESTCAVVNGGVKVLGHNSYGQLGIGSTDSFSHPNPPDVAGLTTGTAAVAAGFWYSCALTHSGGVRCWGSTGTANSATDRLRNGLHRWVSSASPAA